LYHKFSRARPRRGCHTNVPFTEHFRIVSNIAVPMRDGRIGGIAEVSLGTL
jgi:hypothetical protein